MIIAFTKDWNDVPTCTTHILREMAKTIPVLWVESIGTRKPSVKAGGKDVGRIIRRIKQGLKLPVHKENSLYVLSPLLIPKAQSSFAKKLNRLLMAWYIRRWKRLIKKNENDSSDLQPSTFRFLTSLEYWCFVPNAVDLIPEKDLVHESTQINTNNDEKSILPTSYSLLSKIIYYCVDDWTQFHNLDGVWLAEKELALVERADSIFASSRYLADKLQSIIDAAHVPVGTRALPGAALSSVPSNNISFLQKVVYMPHGVEYEKFRRALEKGSIPEDISDLKKPVIGFYGNLHPWVDFNLIKCLASAKPDWNFVLIGTVYAGEEILGQLTNVHLLGRREHTELPGYCAGFDCAIIPYDMTQPRMESVNPVKTKELLAAGVPIVASDVPELRNRGMENIQSTKYENRDTIFDSSTFRPSTQQDVIICKTVDEWIAALEIQIARDDRKEISDRYRGEDWAEKVKMMRMQIDVQRTEGQR